MTCQEDRVIEGYLLEESQVFLDFIACVSYSNDNSKEAFTEEKQY